MWAQDFKLIASRYRTIPKDIIFTHSGRITSNLPYGTVPYRTVPNRILSSPKARYRTVRYRIVPVRLEVDRITKENEQGTLKP